MINLTPRYNEGDILRYLSGKMMPTEQHAIELAALNDPLLDDAIDGYRLALTHNPELASPLPTLTATSASGTVKTIFSKKWLYAAAAAIVLSAGWWMYSLTTPSASISPEIASQKQSSHKGDSTVQTATPTAAAKIPAGNLPLPPENSTLASRSEPMQLPPTEQIASADDVITTVLPETASGNQTASRLDSIQATPTTFAKSSRAEPDLKSITTNDESKIASKNVISGKVVGVDKYPLDGVQITVRETGKTVLSDALGRFNLQAVDTQLTIVASGVGLETRTVRLSANNALNEVQLNNNLSELNDVVVIGYGKEKDENRSAARLIPTVEIDTAQASPEGGWANFETHLYGSRQQRNKITRKAEQSVILGFKVDAAGRPAEIYVIKSAGPDADRKAIKLVETGPSWRIKTNTSASVKVTVLVN